jgi:hypothetical protein
MNMIDEHPEQDPAEGSRETVERDLKRQEEKRPGPKNGADETPETSSPGAEAAEPSPGS